MLKADICLVSICVNILQGHYEGKFAGVGGGLL